jgi:protein O-mannosyl-transferase
MNASAIENKRYLGCFLMVALTCLVYANSFQASWHLDDYANIIYNQKLHIDDLSPASISGTLFARPSGSDKLYRPVACLSFALNWYAGQDNVFGYHLVNLVIHCLAAIFLFKAVTLLFRTPMLSGRYPSSEAQYWIALLAATLWAIHPIQTQAVTYIVQRMASLAGLFYIIGLFCFLKGRLQQARLTALCWFAGALIAYLLALGSKENAVIFPLALVLMEVVFFHPRLFSTRGKRVFLATAISAAVLIGVIAILLINEEVMTALYKSYANRFFNHSERLLTQFRILAYHLFQIAYPSPTHLSIEHDITVSSGLLSPWTTLPAMVIIIGGLWCLLYGLPRFPLLGFGGLFYLLQHSVESSFLPLELIFEHRNYLPSMFLFASAASGSHRLICYYRDRSLRVYRLLAVSGALILCFIGIGTFTRNADWQTEKSLWEDALEKAPGKTRVLHNLAWGHYERIGDYKTAMALYQKAVYSVANRKDAAGTALFNIGNICFNQGAYPQAVKMFKRSLEIHPRNLRCHLLLARAYINLEQWDHADAVIENLLVQGKRISKVYRLKGLVALHADKAAEALKWYRHAGLLAGFQWEDLIGIGQALHQLGYYARSDFFLRSAQALEPAQKGFLLLNRLDLYLDAPKNKKAAEMADALVRTVPAGEILAELHSLSLDRSFYPMQYQRMVPLIEAALKRTLQKTSLEKN